MAYKNAQWRTGFINGIKESSMAIGILNGLWEWTHKNHQGPKGILNGPKESSMAYKNPQWPKEIFNDP